jgi:hypothetical protein
VGCQTVQDGLGGKKRSGSDEFLVQKKNPLVLPPDYQKLPVPISEDDQDKSSSDNSDLNIEKMVKESLNSQNNQSECSSDNLSSNECTVSKSLEKSILQKVNDN